MRIKVLSVDTKDKYISYYNTDMLFNSITKWHDISEDEYNKLVEAINNANYNRKSNKYYFIVQEVDMQEVYDTAEEFLVQLKIEEEKQKKKIQAEKNRKEKAKIERERKKFEQLKKKFEK